jgi:hypothetical protein
VDKKKKKPPLAGTLGLDYSPPRNDVTLLKQRQMTTQEIGAFAKLHGLKKSTLEKEVRALRKDLSVEKTRNKIKKQWQLKQTRDQKPLPVSVRSRKTGKENPRKTAEMQSSNITSHIAERNERIGFIGKAANKAMATGATMIGEHRAARAIRSGAKAHKIKAERKYHSLPEQLKRKKLKKQKELERYYGSIPHPRTLQGY